MSGTPSTTKRFGGNGYQASRLGVEPPDVSNLIASPATPSESVPSATEAAPVLPPESPPAPPPRRTQPAAQASASQFTAKEMAALRPLLDEQRGGLDGLQAVKITVTTRVTLAADRQLRILRQGVPQNAG